MAGTVLRSAGVLQSKRAALRVQAQVIARLAAGGFLAPEEEAAELLAAAGDDARRLEALVVRRLTGEPLAWITGSTMFCGRRVLVDAGVYVPRPHTEPLALRAAEILPERGVAVDVCTGSGAIAAVLRTRRPRARVVATDIDQRAVDCARRNGVDALQGDLTAALPAVLEGTVDVLTAVVPYVPTAEMPFLQRDTFAFESTLGYDGGRDGARMLRRVVRESSRFVRAGGVLLLELGGTQAGVLAASLTSAGYAEVRELEDEDGDTRGIEAVRVNAAPAVPVFTFG